ncbi:SMEK domain-containing protein [Flavitalea sp. BT771]|uniref:SMEK domain-containing protein n=1 Tax=Flavitalea sp. BT771 TaxID=3063329 RepID=UPI0026E45284|nr:SMEK domain-containing protein [Flavitalea sp. BT771]MDO6431527.1 SMEK domain-containing protein [Flavitalea sp. BT771]MDV6220435.1 SMEK domain-containing protein [Flavitalea sp. BT771]
MNTQLYTINITTHLFTLAELIKTKNSLNLTDAGVHAEDIFCALLNKAFPWNLVNANRRTQNHDSFDLEDADKGIYIQVTSNQKHSAKKKISIKSFKKRTKANEAKAFKILFISDHVSPKVLTSEKFPGFTFDAWDLPKLIAEIFRENTIASQLEPINKILQDEFAPKIILQATPGAGLSMIGKPRLTEKSADGLDIRRDRLLNDLYAFTQAGNGLLVGGPGEGKSYLTQELQRKYRSKKGRCYIVRIDKLTSGSDSAITEEFHATGDWLTALAQLPITTQEPRPLLIFDAFDAAKDPLLKSAILKHIQRAIETLKDQWNILVSARIYDASKSTRLLELFPASDPRRQVSCRNFQLSLLETDEIRKVLKRKRVVNTFDKGTASLRQILRIPYFLTIFYDLVRHSNKKGKKTLESVETEEQLLEIYWRKKVRVNTANTTFVQRLTQLLSARLTLACKKIEIAQEAHADVMDDLVSSGVLSESSSGLNLSFAHNILLDYAISLYIIPERPAELVRELEENEMHWFLFRSAYLYFFGRAWRINRDLFWKQYEKIRQIDTPRFRLFRQSILNFVIAELYQSPEDILLPLAKVPVAEKVKTLWKILEAIRFMYKDEVPGKVYFLLQDVSGQLDDIYVWEVGFLIHKAIDQATARKKTRLLKGMATASANFLGFVLKRRKVATSKAHIDRNAGHWGIAIFCLTMEYNKKVATEMLSKVLEILAEPEFPISIFFHLVKHFDHISDVDAPLAGKIFKAIYAHVENSETPTYFNSDVALTLKSNRGQDFQSNRYALERLFPTLLEKHPKVFLPLGIEIVNTYFIRREVYQHGPKSTSIQVDGIKSRISPDYFRYVNAYDKKNDEESFATNLINYLQAVADKKKTALLRSTITIMIAKFEAASLWKELLKFVSKNIRTLKKEAVVLLSEKKLLLFEETHSDALDLLKSAYPWLAGSDKRALQAVVESIQASDYPARGADMIEKIKAALLACFAPREKEEPARPTGTVAKEANVQGPPAWPVDEKAVLLPATIMEDIAHLKSFNDSLEGNREKEPKQADYLPHLPTAQNLFKFRLESVIDNEAFFDADFEVSRFTKFISLSPSELTPDARALSEKVSQFFIDALVYQTMTYQKGSLTGGPQGYSPAPRMYSVETLLHLVGTDPSGAISRKLVGLVSDNNENIRFLALHALLHFWKEDKPTFWNIVTTQILIEENSLSLQLLLQTIAYSDIIAANQQGVEQLALSAYRGVIAKIGARLNDLFQVYATLLLRLYNSFNSPVADELLHKSFGQKEFLSSLIFVITTFIDPYEETNTYEDDSGLNKNCFQLLLNILQAQFDAIGTRSIASLTADDIEPIDNVITQLYYGIVLGRHHSKKSPLDPKREAALYLLLKPLFSLVVSGSGSVGSGFMVGHTGYHFLHVLEFFFDQDPQYILDLIAATITYSAKNNLTYSPSSLQAIIRLTERILADYPDLLLEKENFSNIVIILDHFADSGWPEAVELTVRLKEIF